MLGGEQQDALTITESISQALRLSGASATEAQSALLQFGQALAAGVLRGEEFNSVVENSPRLAKALADGLDVPIGRLRKMAEEGRLTAEVVVKALLSQKDTLAAEYAELPATVESGLAAPLQRLRPVDQPGRRLHGAHQETGRGPDLALRAPRHGDAVAQAPRRAGLGRPGLSPDPGADHRLADRRSGGGHRRQRHHGGLDHRQRLGRGGRRQCRQAAGRLQCAGILPGRLGDRHLALGAVRGRAQGRRLHGRGAGQRVRRAALPLGGVRRHLHRRHHRRGHPPSRGAPGGDERDLRGHVRGCDPRARTPPRAP